MKHFLLVLLVVLGGVRAGAQNIGGIGAQLILDTAGRWTMPRIFSLVPNSPAWDSLRATDYIIDVNGVSCKDKTIEEVVALIRGEVGSAVQVTTADTKQGARPRVHALKRVGMNLGLQADPKDAFFAACDNEAKAMKKRGVVVVKTFNSECGDFFFNFDGANATYTIKVLVLTDANDKSAGFTVTARAFDNDKEGEAIALGKLDSKQAVNGVATLEGSVKLTRECVGTVAVKMNDDGKKCKAMYVIVGK
jgi:hypothetical protein